MAGMAPKFISAHVRDMESPTPDDEPPAGERVIRLNTNENPFPPSPKVMQAIREIEPEVLRRYPSALADAFRAAAGKVLHVDPEMILAGNGADEVLGIATRA